MIDDTSEPPASHPQDPAASREKPRTVEDKQFEILHRYWDLLETLKTYRTRFPFVSSAFLVTITGFVLGKDDLRHSPAVAAAAAVMCASIAVASTWALYQLQKRYTFVDDRIAYLYRQLGISGKAFFEEENVPMEKASSLFHVSHAVIMLNASICIAALVLGCTA